MNFHVLTLFPEMIEQVCATSILGRAQENGSISLRTTNIRDYAENRYGRIDDYTYGGGAGLLIQAGPVCRAMEDIRAQYEGDLRVIYVTPQGRVFDQAMANMDWGELEPMALLGSQVVAGTNYAFLCYGTMQTDEATQGIQIVTVYADMDGNAEIKSIAPVEPADYNML